MSADNVLNRRTWIYSPLGHRHSNARFTLFYSVNLNSTIVSTAFVLVYSPIKSLTIHIMHVPRSISFSAVSSRMKGSDFYLIIPYLVGPDEPLVRAPWI